MQGLGDVDEEVAHLFEGVEDVEVEYGFEVAFTTAFDAAQFKVAAFVTVGVYCFFVSFGVGVGRGDECVGQSE